MAARGRRGFIGGQERLAAVAVGLLVLLTILSNFTQNGE
jgi:hypothetical protein